MATLPREQTPRVRVLDTTVTSPASTPAATPHGATDVVVYWRPGCGFCGSLFRQLDLAGITHRRVNIWDDPDGAATVRSFANGCETVPTVVVGANGLVNPSVRDIVSLAGAATSETPGVPNQQ